MSNIYWLGTATPVAQVDTLTPGGTIEIGDLFKITMTGEDESTYILSVPATATTVTQTCVDIVTAWNAATNALCTPITAGYVGTPGSYTAVTLTADTAGQPFSASVSTTEAGGGAADGQTFSRAATTASSGPNDWNIAANWSGGAVPVGADTVTFRDSTVSVLYGLNQSAVTLASLTIDQSFRTAYIGQAGAYLKISATLFDIGRYYGSGSLPAGAGRIKINLGTAQSTIVVYNSASSATDGAAVEPIQILGTHASNSLTVRGAAKVGVAIGGIGLVSTILNIYVQDSATLHLGSGVTYTNIYATGGTIYNESTIAATKLEIDGGTVTTTGADNLTTINLYSGTLTRDGTGTTTTLTQYGGTLYHDGTGTITNYHPRGGTADFIRNRRAKTITNFTFYASAANVTLDDSIITITNKIGLSGQVKLTAAAA